ncbi:MAG: SDR family oxidoreductase [Clostridia bacterium]|nr:SDR family oxidoreductase [Clostridia bacterium]
MKRAVVTGGTRGIGLAVVRLLADSGYAVTAFYSSNEEDASRARIAVPSAEFLRVNVADEAAVARTFSKFENLSLLVNNAGVSSFSQVQDVSWEEFSRVMNVNAGGTFLCCKHAVKKMLSEGGSIVNVSSVWGQTGGSCESVYSASKGAVIAFSKALAKELAPAKIRVNCVCPGMIDTRMNGGLDESARAAFREEILLEREGTAEEVALAVLFLAEHGYITGEILSVNGGYYV